MAVAGTYVVSGVDVALYGIFMITLGMLLIEQAPRKTDRCQETDFDMIMINLHRMQEIFETIARRNQKSTRPTVLYPARPLGLTDDEDESESDLMASDSEDEDVHVSSAVEEDSAVTLPSSDFEEEKELDTTSSPPSEDEGDEEEEVFVARSFKREEEKDQTQNFKKSDDDMEKGEAVISEAEA